MTSRKKGISNLHLHRTLSATVKTAGFMSHRIREAMRTDTTVDFGSGNGVVEVDETICGTLSKNSKTARENVKKARC